MIPTYLACRYMQRVHDAGFVVFPGYVAYSAEEMAGLANGVGPEAWEQWKRDILGGALTFLRIYIDAAAFMHDCWASLANDGTRAGFEAWNAALRANIIRDAYLDIAPWRILGRWWARRGGRRWPMRSFPEKRAGRHGRRRIGRIKIMDQSK